MKQLEVNELCIEITRRCNYQCMHCMRGDAQNISLSVDDIEIIFHNDYFKVAKIKQLVITGGEPTLNATAIIKIIDEIISNKIIIDSFTMVTNGSIYNQGIVESLNRLYYYYQKNTDSNRFDLICSLDQFHKKPKQSNIDKYMELPYFTYNYFEFSNESITCIGRAFKNNLGDLESFYYSNYLVYSYSLYNFPNIKDSDDEMMVVDEIYVSAKGKYGFFVMDATYDMIDSLCIYDERQVGQLLNGNQRVKRRV